MIKTDHLIIGSGIAGLVYAIKAAELNPSATVTILTKSREDDSNTRYAQGGIAAVLNEDADSFAEHINDTLRAGDGLCDKNVVSIVVKEAAERLAELVSWGAMFDMKGNTFDLAREGGHGKPRILHRADYTGLEVQNTLLRRIRELPNISVLEKYFATELITGVLRENDNDVKIKYCTGVEALNKITGELTTVQSRFTVLATGGVGQVYRHTTNPVIATGDGIAMASRANAVVEGMEFIQFHPTALYTDEAGPSFLISEAVRGMGARLRRMDGSLFMHSYDKREELASRDIVARAIDSEMKIHHEPHVYLDCTMIPEDEFKKHFPTISLKCTSIGIDPARDYIPVVPAVHYLCGGIKTNENGETSIRNLYACGECASTGLHGANRLASNSLLEALVFSHRAAMDSDKKSTQAYNLKVECKNVQKSGIPDQAIRDHINDLKEIMSSIGLVNTNKRLKTALRGINNLVHLVSLKGQPRTQEGYELNNLLTVAKLIVQQSLQRKENRGVFYNLDNEKKTENQMTIYHDMNPQYL
jgi:L-aspartate oxidase